MKPLIKHDRECSILVFGEVQILVYVSLVCMSHKMAEKLRIITICVVTASRCVGLNHCSIHSLWCSNTVDIRLCLSINLTKFYQSRPQNPPPNRGHWKRPRNRHRENSPGYSPSLECLYIQHTFCPKYLNYSIFLCKYFSVLMFLHPCGIC